MTLHFDTGIMSRIERQRATGWGQSTGMASIKSQVPFQLTLESDVKDRGLMRPKTAAANLGRSDSSCWHGGLLV